MYIQVNDGQRQEVERICKDDNEITFKTDHGDTVVLVINNKSQAETISQYALAFEKSGL